MSETDSFIEEVSEEVRRDRLYGLVRRYGWIPVVGVFALVGGAAWNEYSKSQDLAAAQALGDGILHAMEAETAAERATRLADVATGDSAATAVVTLQRAAELQETGDHAAAAALLETLSADGTMPGIYRQIASFKSVLLLGEALPVEERRLRLESMIQTSSPLRLLAEEQLALIDLGAGDKTAALERLERILADAEVSTGLRRRASQLIVALGGDRTGA